ncbi:coiled-coil domain-containing protein 96 [Protopterus annectens]|uniref:coiled-coil domain-containing protein 96 n=1 Tax=Protopterus annectens TaxID=7888 RepID=UPI001CFADB65|nr:coiled-coil domain-containing protein 96 [Protopterus annectens]
MTDTPEFSEEKGQVQTETRSEQGLNPSDYNQTGEGTTKDEYTNNSTATGSESVEQKEAEEAPPKTSKDEALGSQDQPPGGPLQTEDSVSPLLNSDSFAVGDEDETVLPALPDTVEPLPLESSPVANQEGPSCPNILEPKTPDQTKSGTEGEKEEDVKREEEVETEETIGFVDVDREELIKRYHELMDERGKIQHQNAQLQNKLADYFRKKKGEEMKREVDKAVSDQEQRYIKYMSSLEEQKSQYKQDSDDFQQQIEEQRARCQEKLEQVNSEWQTLLAYKKQVAVAALSRKLGKQSAMKEVEELLAKEQRKENEVIRVRLENIKLKNKIKISESSLKAKEELAEGLHLIDFEQLKIENQTYNEKIEERNEELLKLRKKITTTVQVLTHLKEKLQFVQVENQRMKGQLLDIEANVAQKRDILTRTKQARDSLRIDNLKLRQQSGLLSNKVLLRDFEVKVTANEEQALHLKTLKRQYAELTLNSAGIKEKIERTRSVS